MNVQELADRLAEAHDVSKADARAMIDTLTAAIAEAAKSGDEVALPGFGKFKVRERKAREARNPQTGATVKVPASRKLAFLPAKALKDSMNGGGAKAKSGGKAAAKSSATKSAPAKAKAPAGKAAPAAAKAKGKK
jgi:DNA-binding protein HU-beta